MLLCVVCALVAVCCLVSFVVPWLFYGLRALRVVCRTLYVVTCSLCAVGCVLLVACC